MNMENMEQKKTITIADVKNCIGFEPDSIQYKALHGLCDCWYAIEKKKGATDEEAATVALDNLSKKLLEMSA